jgi:hypothetical protein
MLVGSPTYMSPEQGRSSQADPRSDLYALGVVMYESLSGSPPFHGGSPIEVILKHINQPVPALCPPADFPILPAAVENLIMRCLAKEPENRPSSMDEFLLATQALFVSTSSIPSTTGTGSSPYLPIIDGRHISSPPYFSSASPPPLPIALTPSPHGLKAPPSFSSGERMGIDSQADQASADTLSSLKPGSPRTLSFIAPSQSLPPPQPTRAIWIAALVLSVLSALSVWAMLRKTEPTPYLDALPPLPQTPVIQKYNAPEELFEHAIRSVPKGATVFLDDVDQGTTPLELKLPMSQANQSFSVRLELEGFHTLEFRTLLGPFLSPVEKQLKAKPKTKSQAAPLPAGEVSLEDIPSIDLDGV